MAKLRKVALVNIGLIWVTMIPLLVMMFQVWRIQRSIDLFPDDKDSWHFDSRMIVINTCSKIESISGLVNLVLFFCWGPAFIACSFKLKRLKETDHTAAQAP